MDKSKEATIEINEDAFDLEETITNDELQKMIAEQKKLEMKLKEEIAKMDELKKKINDKSNFKDTKTEFNKPRSEFVFKYDCEGGFDEKRIRGYVGGMIKGKSNGKAKIIKYKIIPNTSFIWFKTSEPLVIYEMSKKVENPNFKPFVMTQYRVKEFFDDL